MSQGIYSHRLIQWHKEIHQLCPHIPFILIGTKLDLRRPDPYVLPLNHHKRLLRLTPAVPHSTTPQPQVRPHPFYRFTFSRPTVARSNSVATTSSHSSREKSKKKVKASSSIAQRFGANPDKERPSSAKHTSWYGKSSTPRTSHPQLHHTPLGIDDHPSNSPSIPSASGSPITSSLQATHLSPSQPPTSKRLSLNVSGIGRSLSPLNPFKRTRVGSIPIAASSVLNPHLPATHSEGLTGLPSPLPRPGLLSVKPVLLHRHTTDIITTPATGGRSGRGKNIAFSGSPLTLSQLAVEVTASERERFNKPQMEVSHPISPSMSPIALNPLIGEPITSLTPMSEPDPFRGDVRGPPSSFKGKAKVAPTKILSASTPTGESCPPRSPEGAPGASPRLDEGRYRIPQTLKRNSPVSYGEANALAHEIGASAYIECSALTLVNVVAVFEEAVKIAGESPHI